MNGWYDEWRGYAFDELPQSGFNFRVVNQSLTPRPRVSVIVHSHAHAPNKRPGTRATIEGDPATGHFIHFLHQFIVSGCGHYRVLNFGFGHDTGWGGQT